MDSQYKTHSGVSDISSNIYRQVITGSKIDFLVLDRNLAKTTALEAPYAVISITDENQPEATLVKSTQRRGILRLKFADLDFQPEEKKYKLFSRKDARRILEFIAECPVDVTKIIVHCESGLSRSAGCAAALSQIINGEDKDFFKYYRPNMFVYRTILETLDEISNQ